MNKIGENNCKDILDSFAWDSTGYEESSGIRAREREDSHIWYFRDWFNIVSERGWKKEGLRLRTYQRGFAPKINKFDEPGNGSLCCFDREAFKKLYEEEQPQFLAKFFASQKYTKEQKERYLLTYFAKEKYPK